MNIIIEDWVNKVTQIYIFASIIFSLHGMQFVWMLTEIRSKKKLICYKLKTNVYTPDIIRSVRCWCSDGTSVSSLIIWRPACTELVLWRHRLRDCAHARTHAPAGVIGSCRAAIASRLAHCSCIQPLATSLDRLTWISYATDFICIAIRYQNNQIMHESIVCMVWLHRKFCSYTVWAKKRRKICCV